MNNFKTSQELLNTYIDSKLLNEKAVLEKQFELVSEKKYQTIYFISRFRDAKVNKLNQKIENIEVKFQEQKAKLDFDLGDRKISQSEFDLKLHNLNHTYNSKIVSKIEKINFKKNKYIEKIENIIATKKILIKEKISVLEKHKNNAIEKLKGEFNQSKNKIVENNVLKLSEIDLRYQKSLQNKIRKNKWSIKLEKLEIRKEENKIEQNVYEVYKKEYDLRLNIYKEKISKKNTDINLLKYKIQAKMMKMFGYQAKEKTKKSAFDLLAKSKLILIILIFCIIVGIQNPHFFTSRTWINIIAQNIDLGCMALGMTIIILTGGIDLSIGSTMALTGAILAKFALQGVNIGISLIVMIGVSMVIGLISGFFVSYAKLQPFIITLVLLLGLRGLTYIYLDSKTIIVPDDSLTVLVDTKFIGLPVAAFIFFGLVLIVWIIMRFYKYGRYVYGIGGNINATRLSGIRTREILMSVYVFSGFCVAIGTILYMARTNTITPTTGTSRELDAICAVALGGTALSGGKGGVVQTLIGWFVLSILTVALVMVGVNPNAQLVIKAAVILLAVLSDKKINILGKTSMYLKQIKYSF